MTKNFENLIACVKQTVSEFDRICKNRNPIYTKAEIRKEMFWKLAGIHQSALFILSTDEYYKFKQIAEEIEGGYYVLPPEEVERERIKNERQMTLW